MAPKKNEEVEEEEEVEEQPEEAQNDAINETFEEADAGASLTYPAQAGSIRKNAYMVMNDKFPCRVSDVSTSKTGKHGSAKCNFTAIDIFTGRKYEAIIPSSANWEIPFIFRSEYTLVDIKDDGFVDLMKENGDIRSDLTLPSGTDDADKLAKQLKDEFEQATGDIICVVLKSMGTEMIMSLKVVPTK